MKNTFKRLATVGALTALFSAPLAAETVVYTIDPSHTFANFSYNHMGLSQQINRFNNTKGTIALDTAAKTGEVTIEIDTTSVNTGFGPFNEHIQGEDFLDTAQYPTATFKSTEVIFDGDDPVAVEGELTIKGISKPVRMDLSSFTQIEHPMLKKPALGAQASTQIKRSDFNADKFAPAVSDEVELIISVEAVADN